MTTSRFQNPRIQVSLWVVGSVSSALLVVGMIVGVLSIYELADATRDTQIGNVERNEVTEAAAVDAKAAAEAAARSADRIEDCTTPGRECFEDQVRRTGDAVAGINQGTLAVIVAAISCQADGITEERELARCTAKRAAASTVRNNPAQAQE